MSILLPDTRKEVFFQMCMKKYLAVGPLNTESNDLLWFQQGLTDCAEWEIRPDNYDQTVLFIILLIHYFEWMNDYVWFVYSFTHHKSFKPRH